jgi:hypothetical protein
MFASMVVNRHGWRSSYIAKLSNFIPKLIDGKEEK